MKIGEQERPYILLENNRARGSIVGYQGNAHNDFHITLRDNEAPTQHAFIEESGDANMNQNNGALVANGMWFLMGSVMGFGAGWLIYKFK
jgi:hypothetical protein